MTKSDFREFINRLKSVPCTDCGNSYDPVAMDFDHRNPSEKSGSIASFMRQDEKLLIEIAKCDVVCAVCHRLRTKKRGVSAETIANIRAAWTPEKRTRQSQLQSSERVRFSRKEAFKRIAPQFSLKMKRIAAESSSKKSATMRAICAKKRLRRLLGSFDRKLWMNLTLGGELL